MFSEPARTLDMCPWERDPTAIIGYLVSPTDTSPLVLGPGARLWSRTMLHLSTMIRQYPGMGWSSLKLGYHQISRCVTRLPELMECT